MNYANTRAAPLPLTRAKRFPQTKPRIEATAIVSTATSQTGGGTPQRPGARDFTRAICAAIKIRPAAAVNWKGKGMATCFALDAEIGAGPFPFRAVRSDSAASGARVREQMRQLMAEGTINLRCPVGGEARIEQDSRGQHFGATSRAAQARRPLDRDSARERVGPQFAQQLRRHPFQTGVAPGNIFFDRSGEG